MTDQPMKLVIDVANGTQEYVPLNEEELAQLELDKAAADAERVEREAAENQLAAIKMSAKAKLISGEPLTAEEADTLIL